MSTKVRASICSLVESIVYGKALRDALKSMKHPTQEEKILVSFSDFNLTLPITRLSEAAPVEQGDQLINIISINKFAPSSDAILSFSYHMRATEGRLPGLSPQGSIIIGHVHIKDYIKYIIHFDTNLVKHIVLQIDYSARGFCLYLSQKHLSDRSLSASALNDSSFCSATNSLLSSSFSVCSTLEDVNTNAHLSTYLLQHCGDEDVKITRSLIKQMEMFWSNRIGSSFRRIYHSTSISKIWLVTEKNTAVFAADEASTFMIDGKMWCLAN